MNKTEISEIAQIVASALSGQKHALTYPAGTPVNNYVHGNGGLFSTAGLDQDVFSTIVAPQGIGSVLPVYPSIDTNPIYSILTGIRAATGSQKDAVCDIPQTAGLMKACEQTSVFGRYEKITSELELNRVGQRVNRGEMTDLRLVNTPQFMGGLMNPSQMPGADILSNEIRARIMEVGFSLAVELGSQIWVGTPANNSANGGYKEVTGLDLLINTGKIDYTSGVACPSLDPDVKNFNFNLVSGDAPDIVEHITMVARYIKKMANDSGLSPATWYLAIRPELANELWNVWPCRYSTYRCGNGASEAIPSYDAAAGIAMRDQMRAGQFLLIDGEQWPVVLDNGIYEYNSTNNANVPAGQFASDIYFVPMTVKGNRAVTYMEYMDYSKSCLPALSGIVGSQEFWTDGGRFLWTNAKNAWCLQWLCKVEPRIVLRTPQIAGRIMRVRYAPLQHFRDADPASSYFVNGGATYRANRTGYSEWNALQ